MPPRTRHPRLSAVSPSQWFAERIQPHEQDLRAYLRGQFPTITDLEDIVQESYARLFRMHGQGGPTPGRAYLFVVARNVALDLFRRRIAAPFAPLADDGGSFVVEDKPDAAEITSRRQELALLAEAIDALPPRCREVLVLRRYHGLSYAAIGARLGIAENTVNAQLVNAMLRCRAWLRERGVTPGGFRD